MSNDEMRGIISSVYTGEEWRRKVARMDDCQVVAVYHSFLVRGLIGKTVGYPLPKGVDRMTEIKSDEFDFDQPENRYATQLSIYDLLIKDCEEHERKIDEIEQLIKDYCSCKIIMSTREFAEKIYEKILNEKETI